MDKFWALLSEHLDKLIVLGLIVFFRADEMLTKELLTAFFILINVKGKTDGQVK